MQVLSNHLPFVSHLMQPEGWALFPSARERLMRTVREANASGVVFVSGDVHFGEVAEAGGGCALDYPVMDVTSSGMVGAGTGTGAGGVPSGRQWTCEQAPVCRGMAI